MKKEVWWVQPLLKVWVEMHALVAQIVYSTWVGYTIYACSTPEAMAVGRLVFELSKLMFRGHNLFDGFL